MNEIEQLKTAFDAVLALIQRALPATKAQTPRNVSDEPTPALRARAMTEVSASGVIMFMPGGDHTITPMAGEGTAEVTVRIDESTAAVLNASLRILNERMAPHRVYIDKEHEGKEATAWPEEFFWAVQPMPGVYLKAEYSDYGKQLIEGKVIRGFSPSFFTDAALPKKIGPRQHFTVPAGKRGSSENPARVVGLVAPDIGTLTNNPAFKKILPLWAKATAAGAPSSESGTA